MSLPNEYAHAEQYIGHLCEESQSQSTPVSTRLKVVFGDSARKLRDDARLSPPKPEYEVDDNKDRPIHPWLEAMGMGRHYFEW